MKNKNLIGQKFNCWLVIDFAPQDNGKTCWQCQCDCGTIRNIREANLKSNHSKSCGCLRKKRASETHLIDLTGQKIGYLTVLERDYSASQNINHRYALWKCQCDCGNFITVSSNNLKRQKSCGCIKSFGEQKIKQILSDNNISFIQEYKFKETGNLRFDFYLPDYNRLIEFDGIQHFQEIDYFGGREAFIKQQERDKLKNDFVKSENISLVRIPYNEKDAITLEMLLGSQYLIS